MTRKTQTIDEIVDRANKYLSNTDADMRDRRQGVIDFVTGVLMQTGNYRGFGYLPESEVANGIGGINYVDGVPHHDIVERFANTDPTRIRIYHGA